MFFSSLLDHPGNLTRERILNIVSELNTFTQRLIRVQMSSGAACSGSVGSEGGALAEISAAPNGSLAIACH